MTDNRRSTSDENIKKRKRRPEEGSKRQTRSGEDRPKKKRPEGQRSGEERPKRKKSDGQRSGDVKKRKKRTASKWDTYATPKKKKPKKTSTSSKTFSDDSDIDELLMLYDEDVKVSTKKSSGRKKSQRGKRQKKNNALSRKIGIGLAGLQILASVVFMIALLMLGMLPGKYLVIIAVVLAVMGALAMFGQIKSKKKAIAGKIFSGFMALVLFVASFYIFKANSAVGEISGGSTKLDKIIVAVPIDDPAETIEDAKDYNFGVQYALKGEDIEETVEAINEELGTTIETTEYASVQEQANMLHEGEVDAIILNEAYSSMLEEEFGDFNSNIKIIYEHEIKKTIDNAAKDVKVESEAFTVYISGIDVYGAIETNSRSDVNILAVVNPTSHQILLVTTPRDYYVELPGVSGGQKDKLTHAGIYGVDVSMATLDALYDTESEFYARVNFTSLIQMVDALGGIDVYSEYAFTTSQDSGLVMTVNEGLNHFNGKQALAFSRERQNVPGGDFQRGKDQQAVITAMIRKAISPAILTGASELLATVSGNVDTNMTTEQIQELVKSQLNAPQVWQIKSMAAEGTGDQQYCYSMPGTLLYVTQPDYASVNEIVAAIKAVENGETLEGSETAE